jgi:hypothetical protein
MAGVHYTLVECLKELYEAKGGKKGGGVWGGGAIQDFDRFIFNR